MTIPSKFLNENGIRIASKLNNAAKEAGVEPANTFICGTGGDVQGFSCIGLDDFARRGFDQNHALIFIGAAGIAVRAIAPYVKDKLTDCPVIVSDRVHTQRYLS